MKGWKEKVPEYEAGKGPKPLMIDYMNELEAIWGRRWGAQSECGKLKMVMLHRPREEDIPCEAAEDPIAFNLPEGLPDIKRAQENHDDYVELLKDEGVEVVPLNPPSPPKGAYVSAISTLWAAGSEAIVINGGALIGRSAVAAKRGGEAYQAKRLMEIGCPILYTVHGTGIFERGNVEWLDPEHIMLGVGPRINMEAVQQVEPVLRMAGVKEIHLVHLPGGILSGRWLGGGVGVFHLDLVFNMVDEGLAVAYPGGIPYTTLDYLDKKEIRIIEASEEETLNGACNLVPTKPGRVIMMEGNEKTASELRKEGVDVIDIDFSAFKKLGGSVDCATLPLIREPGPYIS